ncbi:unnamed protein product [Effrenium voratum]|uniref:EF-hand domain-containing protein n=1 Tax=Effrenium voratum TaxID=2562239 RepID=A0AA36J8D0_9DINO|nr:unnamed protein product [Effrenium voratum]
MSAMSAVSGASAATVELQELTPDWPRTLDVRRHSSDRLSCDTWRNSSESGRRGPGVLLASVSEDFRSRPQEEDEPIEAPHSSKLVAPGEHLQPSGDPLPCGVNLLRETLHAQHEEVMLRFERLQQELLSKLSAPVGKSVSPRAKNPFPRSNMSRHTSSEQNGQHRNSSPVSGASEPGGRRVSVRQHRTTSNSNSNGILVPSPKAKEQPKTFSPKLFSSLTRVDEQLRQQAADVDAEQARAQRKVVVSDEGPGMNRCEKMTTYPSFDLFFAAVILLNAVFIGIDVQVLLQQPPGSWGEALSQVVGKVFTVLFSCELIIRMAAQGKTYFTNSDWRWNWLDFVIVVTSWGEWALSLYFELTVHTEGFERFTGMSGLRMLRIIRITRLVKIARLARVLRFIMALRTLTQSILYTLKSLIWAMVLLMLIVYTFAVLFTQVVNDYMNDPDSSMTDRERVAGEEYFGSLLQAMLSLYMSIAGGVSWEVVVLPLRAVSIFWVVIFLFYIAFASLAVLNVITGVFCQSAIDAAQSDHDMVIQSILNNKDTHIEKIRMLFSEIDEDSAGIITFQMFQERIMSEEVKTYFESIDLDVWDAWTFFKLLDMDSGGAVEVEEFLMGCLRLRGNAKAMDIAKLCHDQTWLIREQAGQEYVGPLCPFALTCNNVSIWDIAIVLN